MAILALDLTINPTSNPTHQFISIFTPSLSTWNLYTTSDVSGSKWKRP